MLSKRLIMLHSKVFSHRKLVLSLLLTNFASLLVFVVNGCLVFHHVVLGAIRSVTDVAFVTGAAEIVWNVIELIRRSVWLRRSFRRWIVLEFRLI
jgi:hypothetical protein